VLPACDLQADMPQDLQLPTFVRQTHVLQCSSVLCSEVRGSGSHKLCRSGGLRCSGSCDVCGSGSGGVCRSGSGLVRRSRGVRCSGSCDVCGSGSGEVRRSGSGHLRCSCSDVLRSPGPGSGPGQVLRHALPGEVLRHRLQQQQVLR
jgi:hypothetical protein